MIEISDHLRRALASRPVLAQSQADDLVIEARMPATPHTVRVWLSRVDGTVTVEVQRDGGTWFPAHDEPKWFRLALMETMGNEWEGGIW